MVFAMATFARGSTQGAARRTAAALAHVSRAAAQGVAGGVARGVAQEAARGVARGAARASMGACTPLDVGEHIEWLQSCCGGHGRSEIVKDARSVGLWWGAPLAGTIGAGRVAGAASNGARANNWELGTGN
jgi:hypothetical protein